MRDGLKRNEKFRNSKKKRSGRKILLKHQQELKQERMERVRRKNRMEELLLEEEWE